MKDTGLEGVWTVWHDGDDTPFATFHGENAAKLEALIDGGDFNYVEHDETGLRFAYNQHLGEWEEF